MSRLPSARFTRRYAGPIVVAVAGAGVIAALSMSPAATPSAVYSRPAAFDRAVVVVFENKEFGDVVGNPGAPTFDSLTRRGALISEYTGVAHPSLPNYLALVSGSTQGITSDCTSCEVSGPTLADQLEGAGRGWRTYAEGLPEVGFSGGSAGRYAKKHDPFSYIREIRQRPARMAHRVPFTSLAGDLASGRLPKFSLVIPDICNDMHDCSVATGDKWLSGFLKPLLASPSMRRGVVFVIFDEGGSNNGGGGHTPAFAVGPAVRPGSETAVLTNHYGLLRTIEDAWGLPRLGEAANATPITGIWKALRPAAATALKR